MYNKNFDNNSGFTLIEIIASIALLALVITVLLPIFPQIFQWNGNTYKDLSASNLIGQVAYDLSRDSDVNKELVNYTDKVCKPETVYNELNEKEFTEYTVDKVDYISKYEIYCNEKVGSHNLNLFRTKIKVYLGDTLISESFTYLKKDNDIEGEHS